MNESSNVVVRPSEFESLQYNVLLSCKIPKEKNLQSVIFSNVFGYFFIHETILSAICSKSASFRSRRFPKPRFSTVLRRAQRNTSILSRKSTENGMTKRMGFYKNYLKSAKSVFARMIPKEGDIIFYQLYRFQKMPKRIRLNIPLLTFFLFLHL